MLGLRRQDSAVITITTYRLESKLAPKAKRLRCFFDSLLPAFAASPVGIVHHLYARFGANGAERILRLIRIFS